MNVQNKKKLVDTIVDLVIPTENVGGVRAERNARLNTLTFSEKLNYKLHDKTTWATISLIGYYAYDKDYANAFTNLFSLISAWF